MAEFRTSWFMHLDNGSIVWTDCIVSDEYEQNDYPDFDAIPERDLPAYVVVWFEGFPSEIDDHMIISEEMFVDGKKAAAIKCAEWADYIMVYDMSPEQILDEYYSDSEVIVCYDDVVLTQQQ